MSRRIRGVVFGVLTLAFGNHFFSGDGTFSHAMAASSGGTISGRVVFVGEPPPAKKIKVTKDNEKCGSEITAEELVNGPDRGIQNAVVSIAGLKGVTPKPAAPPAIDQKGCIFRPHVVIVGVGVPLAILNSDGVLHNFHTHGTKNPTLNRAQPGFRKKMSETFAHPEIVKVSCDAHPWMSAWVVVTDHPYIDVTESAGSFKIADVPPGNHTIEVWHESLGKVTKNVTVKDGEEVKLKIELSKN